jgi:hypothetical protein
MPVFSGIFGAAEEAVLSEVHKNSLKNPSPKGGRREKTLAFSGEKK